MARRNYQLTVKLDIPVKLEKRKPFLYLSSVLPKNFTRKGQREPKENAQSLHTSPKPFRKTSPVRRGPQIESPARRRAPERRPSEGLVRAHGGRIGGYEGRISIM